MKRFIYILLMLTLTVGAQAQTDRKEVRSGNRDFKKENYKEADIDYRKALVKDSLSVAANYNLGSTLYRLGDMEQAGKTMERIKDVVAGTEVESDYYYNLGDMALAKEDYQGAVEAFKQSLRLNPGDMDAKENYIYAKKKLEDQQNQQDQQQDQNDDQQDQNDDQQDQNDDQQNQDNQDQNDDQQDQNNKDDQQDQQKQQQQGQQPKISPQAAQQMLQAIQAKEKETQDRVNKEKAEAMKSRQKEKNW